MERKLQQKAIRQTSNGAGLTVLVYFAIMNVAVMVAMCIDMIVYLAGHLDHLDFQDMMDRMVSFATGNGWGYLLAALVGAVIVLLWKGLPYWKEEIFARQKKMTPGAFFCILSVFVAVQAVLQLIAPAFEWILNQIGLSATAALEAASMSATGFSMFLYLAFVGPIAEELLFRGLVLRMLQPHGKQFAIIMSSLLFGLLHGNVIQIPFAFLVGVVLGYVTVEYSIVWAIVLHVFNNFVLSDLLTRLSGLVPGLGEWIFLAVIIVAAIAALIILILRRSEVAAYLRENTIKAPAPAAFFTAPCVLIFGILMILMSLFSITPL